MRYFRHQYAHATVPSERDHVPRNGDPLRQSVVNRLLARAEDLTRRYPPGTPCAYRDAATVIAGPFEAFGEFGLTVRLAGVAGYVDAAEVFVGGVAVAPEPRQDANGTQNGS